MSDKPARSGANQHERNTIIVEDEVLRHGFTQIPNMLLRRNDISLGAKLTYMVLLSYAWQTESCFPGHDRLASDMGVANRSIVTYLQQLKEKGLIRVERRGLGQTNVYRLPRLSEVVPNPRSAKSAHQEVQETTPLEVPILHAKKDSVEEDAEENDLDPSNIRKRDLAKKNSLETRNQEGLGVNGLVVDDEIDLSSRGVRTLPDGPTNGVASVGSILARRGAKRRAQRNVTGQKPYSDERQQLLAFIRDFATEFRDEAPLASSVSRAYNLYTRSGIPLEAFCSFMYEARSLTQEYTSNIKKRRSGPPGAFGPELNKMPYFFSILEELVNQRSQSASVPASEAEPVREQETQLVGSTEETHQMKTDTPIAHTLPDVVEAPQRVSRRPSQRTVAPSVAIATFIKDVSVEHGEQTVASEDHDQAQTLYAQSGLAEGAFLQVLDVTRMIAQPTRAGAIGERMPLFFRALREQLGLDDARE